MEKPIGLLFDSYAKMRFWIGHYSYQFDSINQITSSAMKGDQKYILMYVDDMDDVHKYISIEYKDIIAMECNQGIYDLLKYRIRK